MKKIFLLPLLIYSIGMLAQEESQEKSQEQVTYKKKVLEATEIDFLMSYYEQEGSNGAVNGGIGPEDITDITPTIVVSMPLNEDDVLTIDAGISAYTSASSSDVNPFVTTGASTFEFDNSVRPSGTPWQASTGASGKDVWGGITASYGHSSDDRNQKWNAFTSFSKEYDYTSFGIGGGRTWLFNQKNTEIGISGKLFFDQWNAIYPTELEEYGIYGTNFQNEGYFTNVRVWDENGSGSTGYNPTNFDFFDNEGRNTYSLSLNFNQILSKNLQASIFTDITYQTGLLSTPFQRVYFADVENYYIGNPIYINEYTSPTNTGVFQLADDNEQLPNQRFKIPLGVRANYYINEWLVAKTYYRWYWDDWGIISNTFSIDLPIKLKLGKFSFIPSYRFYNQTAADYFGAFDTLLSTSTYYTSDYDLSQFTAHQYSLGFRYTDIFTKFKLGRLGLKTFNLRYSYYERDTGLKASIISTALNFIMDPKKPR